MKNWIIIFALLSPFMCIGQQDTMYFNSYKRVNTLDKATWYRLPIVKEGDKYKVLDYYKNGLLKTDGYSRFADTLIWDGPFASYYSNGRKFNSGNYMNGYMVGTWKTYYEDTDNLWVLSTYSMLSDTAEILRSFYRSGKVRRVEYRMPGNDTLGSCFSESGDVISYTPYYQPPSFKGDIFRFLGMNLHYPNEAREARVDGTVNVVFTVLENGTLENVEYVNNFLHRSLNEEAVRVIKSSSGKWNPAYIDDMPFRSAFSHKVLFRLE